MNHTRRRNEPILGIGQQPDYTSLITDCPSPNLIKKALHYQEIIDAGLVTGQEDLAKQLGIGRSTVTLLVRLLKLDDEIRSYIVGLDDNNKLVQWLSEQKLRPLLEIDDPTSQQERFWEMIDGHHPTKTWYISSSRTSALGSELQMTLRKFQSAGSR